MSNDDLSFHVDEADSDEKRGGSAPVRKSFVMSLVPLSAGDLWLFLISSHFLFCSALLFKKKLFYFSLVLGLYPLCTGRLPVVVMFWLLRYGVHYIALFPSDRVLYGGRRIRVAVLNGPGGSVQPCSSRICNVSFVW